MSAKSPKWQKLLMTNHLSFWWPADKDYYGVTNGLWLATKKGVRSGPKKWDIIIRSTHKKRVLTFATILEKVEWQVSFIIAACVLRPYEFSAFPSAKFLMDAKIIRPCAARVICSLQILVTNYIFSKQDYCYQYFRSPVQKDFLLFSMERWP